jgi:hypothetical protein
LSRDSIEAVMERLSPALDTLDAIPRRAFQIYRAYNPEHLLDHDPRTQATCVYSHMAAEAIRQFAGRADIVEREVRGLRLWMIEDHTVMRFKKMDEDGTTRNYPTKQAKAFDYMQELPGIPRLPTRITVGYVLDATETQILRVQLARPNGRRVDWCAAIIPQEARDERGLIWEDMTRQQRNVA